jgi:hypothetical protein
MNSDPTTPHPGPPCHHSTQTLQERPFRARQLQMASVRRLCALALVTEVWGPYPRPEPVPGFLLGRHASQLRAAGLHQDQSLGLPHV